MPITYRIGERWLASTQSDYAQALAEAHHTRQRPLCGCVPDGVPMYVACLGERHIVKRMPDTGRFHAPACESYQAPIELSGLGELVDTAVDEDLETSTTTLKLGFRLTLGARRAAAPVQGDATAASVRSEGTKFTLRSLLHYLWEEADLNRWSPGMRGKRSWGVVRRLLLGAAAQKLAKGIALDAALYIPETFFLEQKAAIDHRRAAKLGASAARNRLFILIGEVKTFKQARYGHQLIVKHLPDFPFGMAKDLAEKLDDRFEAELSSWSFMPESHLIVVATFCVSPRTGLASVDEMSLMVTSGDWIPVDQHHELPLFEALTADGRHFTKGLRYNLRPSVPLAAAVLTDTMPNAVALYVVPPAAEPTYLAQLETLIADSDLPHWAWVVDHEALPALPARNDYVPTPFVPTGHGDGTSGAQSSEAARIDTPAGRDELEPTDWDDDNDASQEVAQGPLAI